MTPRTATAPAAPRVATALNDALHQLFAANPDLHLLGEDITDPYGGAFKITKGLSVRYPDRVLSTPLSEGGIVGVAGGLALCGNPVIVEIMFGDFAALGFDQLLNFATKSVSMYGHHVPVPLLLRCPVGGHRGYGPTHSQSLQKHFIGIPHLSLYELTPFHQPRALLEAALGRGTPAVLFEDKVLYTRRMYDSGHVDDAFVHETLGAAPGWAHVHPAGNGAGAAADCVIITPGGVCHQALDAVRALTADHNLDVRVLVPARLYPVDLDPVLPLLRSAEHVIVAEESTAGGTWGSHLAAVLHERLWNDLHHPVTLLSSADSIIPTASHLESTVLLDARTIETAVTGLLAADRHPRSPREPAGTAAVTRTPPHSTPLAVPKLNNNDTDYRVVEWLCENGAWVEAGTPVVALETSKAVQDIEAPESGYVHQLAVPGEDRGVGEVLGHLTPEPAAAHPADRPRTPAGHAEPAADGPPPHALTALHPLDRAQLGTAAVVSRSHAEVPAAYTVLRIDLDHALDATQRISDRTGAAVGTADLLVKAVAAAHADFPLLFGTLVDDRAVALADAPAVGVTVDVGTSLYVPVIRDAHTLPVTDIADALMDVRMRALRKELTTADLDGGNITLSLNPDPAVVLVQPIVMWPQLCTLATGAVQRNLVLDPATGNPVERRYLNAGLAYDHRVVNGRDAVRFLTRIKTSLEDERELALLLTD